MVEIRVTLSESALGDLQGIREWYEEQGVPEVGARLLLDLLEQIEPLSDHPDMGRIVPEFGQTFLRELIRPPFRIVYRIDRGRVRIVRVWRSERLLRLPPSDLSPSPED
ncbi:type II toxin-antitoxin system RelE/ParE family toxin [Thiococcus pfennigii]|jgi:plasmid stabilization system protein ParE|uniref:type II toxin-antitoxin system RelE/ParE family toxin n=1 Tax=Thiococcus pfennigii TaxID=1057 RepID=UPI001902C8E7|nr:type II toxin-antitoxin system RelE/ParE family toxin [Thiococcus pfennigii]MBK1700500.1 addiction module toxin RelE [Thiococcus pfennigii]MBK1733036.1 addiction module toxin RelE [Thiococcus pfennigii]